MLARSWPVSCGQVTWRRCASASIIRLWFHIPAMRPPGVRTTVEEAVGGEDAQSLVEGAASYALGPGVIGSVGVQNYVFTDDLDAPGAENRAIYLIAGLTLVF